MTFPIDFHRHPKIARLSDAAFRAFVEANGESRIAESDGRIDAPDAEFMWKPETLAELLASHPTRPVLLRDGDTYVLRDYAEHQFTTSDRERLAEVSRKNGSKGGRPPKPRETHAGSVGTQSKPESRSESRSGTDLQDLESLSSTQPRDSETDSVPRSVLSGLGIGPDQLIAHIHARTERTVNAAGALRVAASILDRAGRIRKTPHEYVLGSVNKSPAEIQQFIDENGLAS
ncbi:MULTISPECIES: hypothetical protein [unclassified Microbacterium]|uniref:hypothetical protein n=1 Tax=unclassified Microbacterium TaxID=2609290 RepID=UPI003868223F